ncbi:Transposase [Anaerohalosphaera lusitana]|uniref:Transposase n=2 Tax=Anaerohalosphaera lusitana TaxID=1936003 RepID=A0A1U9NQ03_9BACT|nr:Transposase [Anaerohalosphaera lusitana]AQT70301.1 Transposase [Anaerohalosphaera lusitana]
MALSYYPTMINKYKKRSKISEAKFRQIVKLFALDIEATKIAELTGLSRKTINTILYKIRIRIAEYCQQQSPFDVGEIEIDESYFGARRVRGVRGRGAKGKHIVFGLIKRGGKVYTQVVRNCSKSTLMPIIKQKVDKDSIVYTDGFKTYDGLVDFGYKKHYRVKHGENEFAEGHNHINGIENFWAIAKGRLNKFRGISKGTFALHLKECEFRFNHRHDDLYKLLLKILRKNPI